MVELLPVPMLAGDADIVMTGATAGATPELTPTDVDAEPDPPALLQLKV
jgi:hypothetical protein